MPAQRSPFEATLDVLGCYPTIRYVAVGLLLGGVLLLFAPLSVQSPPSPVGIVIGFIGLVLWIGQGIVRLISRTRRVEVRADDRGIWRNNRLAVRGHTIANGYFRQRPVGPRSSVLILDRWGGALFEAAVTEPEAMRFLQALALDAGSRRAQYSIVSPLFALRLGASIIPIGGLLMVGPFARLLQALDVLRALGVSSGGRFGSFDELGAGLLLSVLVVVGLALPRRLIIGLDGIHLRWFFWKRFIPLSKIQQVVPEGYRIRLVLEGGQSECIPIGLPPKNSFKTQGVEDVDEKGNAIIARIRESMAAMSPGLAKPEVVRALAKGGRSHAEWIEALTAQQHAEGAYRGASYDVGHLWIALEDPSAPADVRAGAALALRRFLDDEGKTRMRAVAESTASPALRAALEAVAGEDADAELYAAMGSF